MSGEVGISMLVYATGTKMFCKPYRGYLLHKRDTIPRLYRPGRMGRAENHAGNRHPRDPAVGRKTNHGQATHVRA